MHKLVRAAFLAALAFALIPVAASAGCRLHQGDHVVLYSGSEDPDVFLWDSRYRLRAYHAASYDEGRQLANHALLVSAGARAIVESCVPDFVVSPLFPHPADAVGILVVNGPHRGITGWVLGTDLQPSHHPPSP